MAEMDVNPDFRDLFKALNEAGARYLVIGAHAVMFHSEPRYTKDLDVWVEPTSGNSQHVWAALHAFAAPLREVLPDDFSNPDVVFQMGREPNRIDVLTSVAGVKFLSAWKRRIRSSYGNQPIFVIGREDLIRNKKAAGRPRDLLDAQKLIQWGKLKAKRSKRKRS